MTLRPENIDLVFAFCIVSEEKTGIWAGAVNMRPPARQSHSFVNPISSHKARVLSVTNPYDSTIQSIHIEISINANVKLLMDDKMQWVYHLD